jgi:inner membrane protein
LLEGLDRHWPVERLKWFTHGFYSTDRLGSDIVITDLRMGLEPNYVFSFKVAQMGNPHAIPSKSKRVFGERGWKQLKWVWQRIWTDDPEVARYREDQKSI